VIGQTISHFKITTELGRGGMGIVYKAVDTQLHVERALKFLSADTLGGADFHARFIEEARSLASVQHPNICPVHEIGEVDGQVFIAMSFLEGQTLEDKLTEGPLPVEDAVLIAKQVAAGLQKAHGQGVIHRDIKPANIMITDDGPAVIMDFGLAKRADAAFKTRTGTMMGTVAYMSPEQVQSTNVDHRADLWALGVMMYEMLTGQRPFKGDIDPAVIFSLTQTNPDPIAPQNKDVPAALEEIVERLLEKEPGHRYADAGELLDVLEDTGLVSATGTIRRVRLQRWQRRRLGWVLAGVIPLVVLVMVAMYVWPGFLNPGPGISRLAVLPFVEPNAGEEQAYFADGMTNELISNLTKIRSLSRVISSGSVIRAVSQYETFHDIGTALGVDVLVHCSISQLDERVRFNVQLIRVSNEDLIWAESYVRNRQDVLDLQSDIVRDVVQKIQVQLSPQEEIVLETSREVNPAAYDAYLKGHYHLQHISDEGLEKSFRYFRQSIDLDPTFAPAWAGLATYYRLLQISRPRDTIYPEAKAAIERALELDENMAQAHAEAGILRFYFEWDWERPAQDFERAYRLEPMNGHVLFWYTVYLANTGRHDDAIAMAQRLVEMDPLTTFNRINLGWAHQMAGQHEQSIVELEKARELDPDLFWIPMELAWNYTALERYPEAFEEFDRAIALDHENFEALLLGTTGRAYALGQRTNEAKSLLAQLEELAKEKYVDSYFVAYIPAGLDDADLVFQWLQRAFEERSASMISLKNDANFSEFRSDQRFSEILRQMNIPTD